MCARCARCGTGLVRRSVIARSNASTAAIALAALILYPPAVALPMLEVERYGHTSEASILESVAALFADGHWFVGLVVLICSIVVPLGKLFSMLVLALGGLGLRTHHRAFTYRLVEWTGRWGMLDVLLVAVLVAVLKLGDVLEVHAGPAAVAFTLCVVLSLLAAASFDAHAMWQGEGRAPERAARRS